MKLTTGIFAAAMMTGAVWAQDPSIINNVQGKMAAVQQKQTADSNAALGITDSSAATRATKPTAGAPTPAVKPAQIPNSTGNPTTTSNSAAKTSASKVQTTSAKPGAKSTSATAKSTTAAGKGPAAKTVAATTATSPHAARSKHVPTTKIAANEKPEPSIKNADAPKDPKPSEKKWAMSGKRDPFFSPIVQQVSGSGCSTGKKCLEIGQINVRGVVKSDSGFIAVVTNSMNKAYFLHENDPVFNGYVMRITGDSVVFQETVQDKLGKPVTREVTKRLVTPAV
jgi:Tfp pilus assembly protein PilP